MRNRRPYLFSDTIKSNRPVIAREVFELQLDTLTSRKQEGEFETFCRRLAEREICPNLRVQTGPTGGGDSKVDSETYPVTPDVAERWWVGEPASASERWAFAFSAKKDWSSKVRADVKKIWLTQRGYRRIYFFSNQFISDKKRAELEDKLKAETTIPVHIVDRNWIVEKVYTNNHLDLAISSLGLQGGETKTEVTQGPQDTKRLAELSKLESDILNPEKYSGARFQLAEDCLQAAILARGLDRSRYEVDGRFGQAERIANEVGDPRQQMRIAYNQAWTAHWWYEDYQSLSARYTRVEELLRDSDEAEDIEKLVTLLQLIFYAEMSGHLNPAVAQFEDRKATLTQILEVIAANTGRPNNALQAKTSLVLLKMFDALKSGSPSALNNIWREFSEIVDASQQLVAYPIQSLEQILKIIGDMSDGEAFDELYVKVVELMRKRRSDGEAGIAYRDRGIQQLNKSKPYEAIRWMGKAEELLLKEEYQDELIMTLFACGLAYRHGGLLWAARSKILVAFDRSLSQFASTGQMPATALSISEMLVWVELQLGRVPSVLQTMAWHGFVARQLKLSENEKKQVAESINVHEAVLGMLILNLTIGQLARAEELPDPLERNGLTVARLALLHALGHTDRAIKEGYFSESKTVEEINRFFESWQDQPASHELPAKTELGESDQVELTSTILGAQFVFRTTNEVVPICVAESLLGALEALLATSLELNVTPAAERTLIRVHKCDGSEEKIALAFTGGGSVAAEIRCPESMSFSSVESIRAFSKWINDSVMEIFARRFIVHQPDKWINEVAGKERALTRAFALANMVTVTNNVYGGAPKIRLRDWIGRDETTYECTRTQQWRLAEPKDTNAKKNTKPIQFQTADGPEASLSSEALKHTDRKVFSPIDVPLWNSANWGATLFASHEKSPPILGISFHEFESGLSIFRGWQDKWAREDFDESLRICIVRGIDKSNPAHYAVLIGSNPADVTEGAAKEAIFITRILHMTPTTSKNLDWFLKEFRNQGKFLLVPARMPPDASISLQAGFIKRHLVIRDAWEIGENDLDISALRDGDEPVIPEGIAEPPVVKTLASVRKLREEKKRV
jgi:hypothetical protein